MVKKIINQFQFMEEKIKKIMHYGFLFSFIVCMISMGLLITYEFYHSPDLFYIGLSVFRLSLFFVVEFIICALATDTIKKQIG